MVWRNPSLLLLSRKPPSAYIWGAIHGQPSNHTDMIKKHISYFWCSLGIWTFEYLGCLSSFHQLLLEAEENPRSVIPGFSRAVTPPRAGAAGDHTGYGQA